MLSGPRFSKIKTTFNNTLQNTKHSSSFCLKKLLETNKRARSFFLLFFRSHFKSSRLLLPFDPCSAQIPSISSQYNPSRPNSPYIVPIRNNPFATKHHKKVRHPLPSHPPNHSQQQLMLLLFKWKHISHTMWTVRFVNVQKGAFPLTNTKQQFFAQNTQQILR